jgi:scyllo-inositol 2-dehydrogenase (NADP+)
MEQPIVTALLAYGMSGKVFHAPFLEAHPGFSLYAVLERNQKKALHDYPSIHSYSTLEELLHDDRIELVVINTPNNTHYEFALLALLAHKHILIEKPATTTSVEFEHLLQLASQVGRQVFVYQNRRWSSDIMATKTIIESGKLGAIIEMHLRFDRYRPVIGPKTFKETPIPSSGIAYDLGAHLVDQAIALFGTPLNYQGFKKAYRTHSLVDDYASIHLEFPRHINVFITMSHLVADPQAGIVVHGTQGSFIKPFCDVQEEQLVHGMKPTAVEFGHEKPHNEGKLTYYNKQNEKNNVMVPSLKGHFMGLFEELYASIRHQQPFSIDNQDIITQIKILESL